MTANNSRGDVAPIARRPSTAARPAAWATALALVAGSAQALEMDAGDDTALPAGTNLGVLYYQHVERDRLYANGRKVDGDNRLDSDVGILRYVHYTKLGGMTINPQFLLPFGSLRAKEDLSPLGSASGAGDLILASVFWLVENPETQTYFAITPYLYLPTGNYDHNKALNLGENRWKGTLQLGYITGLTNKLLLDLYADVTVFGENNDYGASKATLKQDALFQAQSWLRYKMTDAWDLRAGYFYTWGGETKVDGVANRDRARNTKFQVGTAWFYEPSAQVIMTYGQDLHVENGFKETSRINLRWLKVF